MTRIFEWLRPGGYLLLSIEDDDQPGVVGPWLGVDMFFSTRPAEEMRRLVGETGFEVVRCQVESQFEGETEIPYTWILARRPRA